MLLILRWHYKLYFIFLFIDLHLVHIFIAAVWTLHNDVIDYVFGQMPIYRSLNQYMQLKLVILHFGYLLHVLVLHIVVYQKRSKRIS